MKNYKEQEFKECCGKCKHVQYRRSEDLCGFSVPKGIKKYVYGDTFPDISLPKKWYKKAISKIVDFGHTNAVGLNGICDNFQPRENSND